MDATRDASSVKRKLQTRTPGHGANQELRPVSHSLRHALHPGRMLRLVEGRNARRIQYEPSGLRDGWWVGGGDTCSVRGSTALTSDDFRRLRTLM